MKKAYKIFLPLLCLIIVATACEEGITTNPADRLSFSADTLRFDTLFTEQTSPTITLKVYNPNSKAILINSVRLEQNRFFFLNIDGEADPLNMRDIRIEAKDSMYVFLKANFSKHSTNDAVLLTDRLLFNYNDQLSAIEIEAVSQNVRRLTNQTYEGDVTFDNTMPYLVYDTLLILGNLTITEGAKFYMHEHSVIFCLGNVVMNGTVGSPIVFRGDRTDNLFTDVPYDYVSGNWLGIYILQEADAPARAHTINCANIHSAAVGLFCQSPQAAERSRLTLTNSVIYNMSAYGVTLQNIDAELINNEISNCSMYCLYLSGGKHTIIHNTIASYFNSKEAPAMHYVGHEDVAAVYINDVSKNVATTETYMHNNVIAGSRQNNLVLATPLLNRYVGSFTHNYLINDTLPYPQFSDNIYGTTGDTVFVNTVFRSETHEYYDFRLDSLSPARGIADTAIARLYQTDRLGNDRLLNGVSDAGCYAQ